MPGAFVPHRYGFLMAAFCVSAYLWGAAMYNYVFIVRILPEVSMPLAVQWACGAVWNTLWLLAVWSYLRARYTHPGAIPSRWSEFAAGWRLPVAPAQQEWQPGQATRCSKCGSVRPERAHHCSASGECVLRMDHYCPWTATCIGFHNHKFFLLTANYGFLMALVYFVTTVPACVHVARAWLLRAQDDVLQAVLGVSYFLALLVSASLTYLFGGMVHDHMANAFENLTCIEECYDNMPNPYDLGHWFVNLSQVLGRFGPDWLLPVAPCRPVSDGVSFARAGEDLFSSEPGDLELHGNDRPDCEELWHRRYVQNARTLMVPVPQVLGSDQARYVAPDREVTDDSTEA